MNFCSQGFYEEDQNQLPHKNLVPLAFHQRGSSGGNSWLENKYENHRRTSAADEISSNTIRYYNSTGAAVPANLELMEASPSFRNNSDDDHEGGGANSGVGGLVVEVEREHMFDKVVTPSDVGKLNRLVIPKQHAEKYFPLDSSSNDKGLLLNFEDRNGKPWRFRYSYWNSSQSYVMTKGWSRFVKEKKLDAGDIVSFQRGLGELGRDRLFIDWRRRPEIPPQGLIIHPPSPLPQHYLSFQRMSTTQPPSATTAPLFFQPQAQFRDYTHFHNHPNSSAYNQPHHSPSSSYGYGYGGIGGPYATYNSSSSTTSHPYSSSVIYLRSAAATHVSPPQVQAGMVQLQSTGGGGGGGSMDIGSGIGIGIGSVPTVFESVPVVRGKAAAKRLRLFGVNMDCPISESDECDILSSTTTMPNAATMAPPWPSHPPPYLSSSSSSNIPPLQLRLYNGNPLPTMHPDKGNKSNKSFDLDI